MKYSDANIADMDEKSVLDAWAEQYGANKDDIFFSGYVEMGSDVLGKCAFAKDGQKITLNRKLEGHDIYARSTLWHEFCHAWDYQDTGVQAHNASFWGKYFRKPWCIIIDFFASIHCHTH